MTAEHVLRIVGEPHSSMRPVPAVAAIRLLSLLPRSWAGTVKSAGDSFVLEISTDDTDFESMCATIGEAFLSEELAAWTWVNPPR